MTERDGTVQNGEIVITDEMVEAVETEIRKWIGGAWSEDDYSSRDLVENVIKIVAK